MKTIDVHPDELFDREQMGTLTADERARLSLHLSQCGACRLERQLCQDFAEELLPAVHAPSLHSVVVGALQAAHFPLPEAEGGGSARAQSERLPLAGPARQVEARPRARERKLAGIAAGVGLVLALGVGAAAAQIGLLERVWRSAAERLATSAPNTPRGRPTARAPEAGLRLATNEQLAATETTARGSVVGSSTEHASSPAQRRRSTARRTQRQAATPTKRAAAASQPAAAAAAPVPVPDVSEPPGFARAPEGALRLSANKLFELANAARHQGDVLEASGLYRELRGRFPGSAEARLSLAVLARMQLDRGEARSALLGFDAYLQTEDRALREEAMAGRALALERLGRDDESARAFEALQQAFPRSAYSRAWRERQGKATP